MKGISPELMQVNTNDDITRWWEVMDRTTGQPVPPELWSYADGSVTVQAVPFHEYTVSSVSYTPLGCTYSSAPHPKHRWAHRWS